MSLKCKECGSRDTKVISARELSAITNDTSVLTTSSGKIDIIFFVEAIKYISQALGRLFEWLKEKEKNDSRVVVCKDCGYWEKI